MVAGMMLTGTLCSNAMNKAGEWEAPQAPHVLKADTTDILSLFTYCWGGNEWLVNNDDGSVTFHAQTWGGMAAWLQQDGHGADWSEYEKVVFEYAEATTVNTQILVGSASGWGERGITRLECLFDGHDMSSVDQIALQTSNPATITVTRVYLVTHPYEESEEGPGEINPDISQLVINEIMQSNIDCLLDDINDYPDSWVELFNNSTAPIQVSEYALGDSPDAAKAWPLPDRMLGPGQYALVYCDKVADRWHTNFRIDSGKDGAVYLFHNGQQTDKATPKKKQPAPNIAYGRKTNGAEEWGYMTTPTPGKANCGSVSSTLLGEPVFSEPGRVTTGHETISLTLSLPEGSPEGTVIRYTINGSEPTESSPEYTGPITIYNTRTVRAKLFCEGFLSPRSTTHSYLYLGHQLTLPVVSIVTDDKHFYHNKQGIYVNGTYSSSKKNYEYDWRRPINFEYFEGENTASLLNQLCETRVQGGASRGAQLKSLVVYANKRFGTKRLDYEFFPDQRPGVTDFKSIILRNAGNDFDYLYMRDAVIQRTMARHTDLDWQAWRPVVIYINGVYKGMLNIRERSNEDNIYTHYDGLEDIDMIENWNQLKEGDMDHWNAFAAFYGEHGHTLEEYEQWIDWREFLNLMVMNLFYNNQDFPGNNIVMWRPRTEGGVWRFIAKDTDFGLGLYGTQASYNTIAWIYDPNYDSSHNWANHSEHTRLFRRMMEVDDFKREFIDRAAIYMGDFMNQSGTREVWDPMYEMIKTEYPYHRELINRWWPNYSEELTNARNWLRDRCNYFYNHLANYYGLGRPIAMEVNKNMDEEELRGVDISINGVRLSKGIFDGKFFQGRSLTLSGTPADGKQVTGWKVITITSQGSNEQDYDGPTFTLDMPACSRLIVRATLADHDGIEETADDRWQWRKEADGLTLSGLTADEPVRVYNLQGMLLGTYAPQHGRLHLALPQGGVYIIKTSHTQAKIKL